MAPAPVIDLTLSDDEDGPQSPKPTLRKTWPKIGYFTTSTSPTDVYRPSSGPLPSAPMAHTHVHGNSKNDALGRHGTQVQSSRLKRTANEAFGRNDVSELLHLVKTNLGGESSLSSTPNESPQSTTPDRTSVNDLLSRFATEKESGTQNAVAVEEKKRSRVVHADQTNTSRKHGLRTSRQSLVSLTEAAEQSSGTGGKDMVNSPTFTYQQNRTETVHNIMLETNGGKSASSSDPARLLKLKSPSTPKVPSMPILEGLGTSPRIVQIRDDPSFENDKQPAAVPLVRKSSASSIFRSTSSHGPTKLPPINLVRQNPSTSPATQSIVASIERMQRFDRTVLKTRIGRPWTDAEIIMVGYLYEVRGMSWNTIDKKMGRGHNACATKYSRIPSGLKNPAVKIQMRWTERIRAIEALLTSIDLNIEQAVDYLQRNIETDLLPKEAAEVYKRLIKSQPVPAARVSILHDSITVVSSSRTSPASGSDAVTTIATTRQRRNIHGKDIVSNHLQLRTYPVDGQPDVNAMIRTRNSTPDSVLVSDRDQSQQQTPEPEELVSKNLIDFDIEEETAEDLEGLYIIRRKPYLSSRERNAAARAVAKGAQAAEQWYGVTLHHGFSMDEIVAVVEAIKTVCPDLYDHDARGRLHRHFTRASRTQLAAIAACAGQDDRLSARTRRSIVSFLRDVTSGHTFLQPERVRISSRPTPISVFLAPSRSLLRRELGVSCSTQKNRDKVYDSMNVTRSFTGASGDVGNLAWSPSGTQFAASAICLVDPSSMQYNQPNNLLFGNIEQNTLYEIPDHHRLRTKPAVGVNATHSMHVSQDHRLFETVSMVDFSHDGSFMFSVGYDNFLRAFKVDGNRGDCKPLDTFDHRAKIDLLSVNRRYHLMATGAANISSSIKIFSCDDSGIKKLTDYYSPRAKSLIEKKITPSVLKWGVHSSVSDYLMAGFSSNISTEVNAMTAYGELCLWNVEKNLPIQVAPAAGNTFDCSWSPSSGLFMTACAAHGPNLNRGTKSLVRVYNPIQEASGPRWTTRGLQMDCPALDINDVLFNPYNQLQVVAGATDGTVYVWDLRRPDNIMHKLQHGNALIELDTNYAREVVDTGVRFCSWADRASRMYSASSDGVLKLWDVSRATEDALVKDVVTFNSGIMSGAFTHDHSKLLIGEVNGSINLLEVGADPTPLSELKRFTLQPFEVLGVQKAHTEENSGIAAARSLVRDGKIEIRPLGSYPKSQAVQGPAYSGPYDYSPDAAELKQRSQIFQVNMATSQHQCSIPSCKNAGRHFGTEETEDSSRSSDRIPQAIRDAVNTTKDKRTPSTTLKCTHCNAPARVREDDMAQAAFPLCERCSFGCLRCGESNKISSQVDKVACLSCGLKWDIGALGYSLDKGGNHVEKSGTKQEAIRDYILADEGGVNDMGDLLHLVEGYHHSLWK